jgi:hypothetical protein
MEHARHPGHHENTKLWIMGIGEKMQTKGIDTLFNKIIT